MAEDNSIITPHGAASRQNHHFVAGGGTCTCSTVKQHGRLLLKKQLLPEKAADQRHRQALEKEFEIGYALNHPNIPRYLGLRHRSAQGITEVTDAIAIIVSEESGGISYAYKGALHTRLSTTDLENALSALVAK